MKILVYPASTELGGSQLNAIDLASAVAGLGHEVVVFGQPGPLCQMISAAGLPFIEAPAGRRPSPRVMRALNKTVAERQIDLVHGYEWPPIIELACGPNLRFGTPLVGTVMSMGVAPFIPRHFPLIVGTAQIADAERHRRREVHLIEPPVDTNVNAPDLCLPDVRNRLRCAADDLLLVLVSRLANELKLEGVLDAIKATAALAPEAGVRLVVVGDGPARPTVEQAALRANAKVGREVITLTGEIFDPRPYYEAADVCLGMGSSALRAMAFAKPLVVQGERGFWELLTPETVNTFLNQGWYGIGTGDDGAAALMAPLRRLAQDKVLRAQLGDFSRNVVVERFGLDLAARSQELIYEHALCAAQGRLSAAPRLALPMAQLFAYKMRRRRARRRGGVASDDFNALSAQPRVSALVEHAVATER